MATSPLRGGGPWIATNGCGRPVWRRYVSPDAAYRRAGGRRLHNAERARIRAARRDRLAAMIVDTWPALISDRGWQADAARALGVDRATVCRDVDAVLAETFGEDGPISITYRLLRALVWTPAERRRLERRGLAAC